MIGGPNLRYVRVEPPLAQCTGTAAVTQFTILLYSGVHFQSGLRDSGTLIYTWYIYIISSYFLLRLMVPRRVPRAISPLATLHRAYR